jgi:hypothetical protein
MSSEAWRCVITVALFEIVSGQEGEGGPGGRARWCVDHVNPRSIVGPVGDRRDAAMVTSASRRPPSYAMTRWTRRGMDLRPRA